MRPLGEAALALTQGRVCAPAIREVACRSLANPSRIPGIDYTINPYTGCAHACVYCYVPGLMMMRDRAQPWGTYVDVKVNAPQVLLRELRRLQPGKASLSTVTDPYQPPEREYRVTRQVLRLLVERGFPISILTKSPLVTRDLDLLRDADTVTVGMSINTLDEHVRRTFEPGAPSIRSRIRALAELNAVGIETWVFVAPMLPFITEETIADLLDELREAGVSSISCDGYNAKPRAWERLAPVLQSFRPGLRERWQRITPAAYQPVIAAVDAF